MRRSTRATALPGAGLRTALLVSALVLIGPAYGEILVVEAELIVPTVQRLEVVPGTLRAPTPAVRDLERGWVDFERPLDLEVSSNVSWTLLVRRVPSGGATGPDLMARASGAGFVPVTESWTGVLFGEGSTHGEVFPLELRIALNWLSLPPGTLEPRLEFRLEPRSDS